MPQSPVWIGLIISVCLCACVTDTGLTPPPGTDLASCAERARVARQLAEQHQYGGDMQAHIAELARAGASEADLADYRRMADKLARVPQLAGDGGREMGVEAGLEELGLSCA